MNLITCNVKLLNLESQEKMIMINLHNAYLLLSLVNITDAELKKKRQRALELKQFLLDNKVRLHAIRLS